MSSSSIPMARLIVGGLYLLKALAAAAFLVLTIVATVTVGAGGGGAQMVFPPLVVGLFLLMLAGLWGSIGVGLIKGSRIALAIAIAFAGLGAIGALTAGAVVPFFLESAIFCGLLMSRDIRKAYQ